MKEREDWIYYVDEIETTDTGSYTPSEVETIEAYFDSCVNTPTVTSPMGEWLQQHGLLSSMPADPLNNAKTMNFTAGQCLDVRIII